MQMINGINTLTQADFESRCPSFYAEQPHHGVSDKYDFINTRSVALALWDHGWQPTHAEERRVRNADKRGLTHHVVRFAHRDLVDAQGDRIEIVVTNSHDRASAFNLMAGIFRMVCSNGLIAQTSNLGNVKIIHKGDVGEQVQAAVQAIGPHAALVAQQVDQFKAIELTRDEQGVFAHAALDAVYGDGHRPIGAGQLLHSRRYEDRQSSDLWTTFNVVQENVVRGGLRGRATTNRRMRTREIQSIDRNVKVNQALWTLAEGMADMKSDPDAAQQYLVANA